MRKGLFGRLRSGNRFSSLERNRASRGQRAMHEHLERRGRGLRKNRLPTFQHKAGWQGPAPQLISIMPAESCRFAVDPWTRGPVDVGSLFLALLSHVWRLYGVVIGREQIVRLGIW